MKNRVLIKYESKGISPDRFSLFQSQCKVCKPEHLHQGTGLSVPCRQDLMGVGISDELALPAFISLCSGALGKPVHESIVILDLHHRWLGEHY